SRRSTVGPGTERALIVSEGMHQTAPADVAALLNALAEGVSALWSPPVRQVMLTAAAPKMVF
ncbi:MAG: hypothetical protein ACE5G8_13335, partial [Anaerolineae bacterium]